MKKIPSKLSIDAMLANRDLFQSFFFEILSEKNFETNQTSHVIHIGTVRGWDTICVGYARDWIAIILDLPLWPLPKLINLKPTNNANATF